MSQSSLLKRYGKAIEKMGRNIRAVMQHHVLGRIDPPAVAFYERLMSEGRDPRGVLHVLPEQRILYAAIPKAACTRIKATLSALIGRNCPPTPAVHDRQKSGLKGPRHVGITALHRLATDPDALRFAFVRNPYDRLVSCWADKFRHRPLLPGHVVVDRYLALRDQISPSLPGSGDHTLAFSDFVVYATATCRSRIDAHWEPQDDLLNLPGVELNFVGKTETFNQDFGRVLDFIGASDRLRHEAIEPANVSQRGRCRDYYTDETAALVYRTYECDFDRFGYPKALPD